MAKEMKFSYGGQAVMEGVMMRGQRIFAVAVRDPNGEVLVHKDTVPSVLYRGRISKTPFLRGVVGLWDSLGLGMRALLWSADVAVGDEASFSGPLAWGTVAVSLMFGIGLFFVLPAAASKGIEAMLGLEDKSFLANLIEGAVRLVVLIGYVSLVGLMPDMRRVFAYHGAEHKTINAYEAGAELTPEIVQNYPIEHPRCGTAFLLLVVFVGVLVFSIVPRGDFVILLLSRVLLIPVVAGIAYEVLRWTAKNLHRPWVRVMIKPNLALQHLTTRQPSLEMLEVAIAAFKHVLVSEGELDEAEVAKYRLSSDKAAAPQAATTGA